MQREKQEFLSLLGHWIFEPDISSEKQVGSLLTLIELGSFVNEEKAFESAILAMIERASLRKELATQWFILLALHLQHWSYKRLANVLKTTTIQIEEWAWLSRIHFLNHYAREKEVKDFFMRSRQPQKSDCPSSVGKHPWPQRFLDECLHSIEEQGSLKNHLFICHSCRERLNAYRIIYFWIDAKMREVANSFSFSFLGKDSRNKGPHFFEKFEPWILRFLFFFIPLWLGFQLIYSFFLKK